MNITEILQKLLKGEEITAEEKVFASVYQGSKNTTQKNGDDEKIKELEQKLAAEQAEKAELAQKIKEAEEAKLSENELLQKKLDEATVKITDLSTTNSTLQSTLESQTFDINLNALASKYNCNDSDYLKFKIEQQKDFNFDKGGDAFMEQFQKDSPQYFNADIKGGGGDSDIRKDGANPPVDKISELEKKENLSLSELAEGLESLNNNKNNE